MISGVTRHMLPHLPGVPHLHVNGPLILKGNECIIFLQYIVTNNPGMHCLIAICNLTAVDATSNDRIITFFSNKLQFI